MNGATKAGETERGGEGGFIEKQQLNPSENTSLGFPTLKGERRRISSLRPGEATEADSEGNR